jgi:hypothetical protein
MRILRQAEERDLASSCAEDGLIEVVLIMLIGSGNDHH